MIRLFTYVNLALEARHDLLIEVFHGHAGDVPQLLQDLVRARRVLVRLDCPQHGEDLVDDFAWDEAAEVEVNILEAPSIMAP